MNGKPTDLAGSEVHMNPLGWSRKKMSQVLSWEFNDKYVVSNIASYFVPEY